MKNNKKASTSEEKEIKFVGMAKTVAQTQDTNPLRNWERWVTIRSKQNASLGKSLDRHPHSLLMNIDEEYHKVAQDKVLLEKAATIREFDKYRGDPDFWKVPQYLKNFGNDALPPCFSVKECFDRTKVNYKIPIQEFVGLPETIRNEMGIIGRSCKLSVKEKWDKSEYVARLRDQLEENVKKIAHHNPDVSDLVVVGCTRKNVLDETSKVPILTYSNAEEDQRCQSCDSIDDVGSIHQLLEDGYPPTLKIEDIFVTRLSSGFLTSVSNIKIHTWQEGSHSDWKVRFSDCRTKTMYSKPVRFENVGPVSIRYTWKRIEMPPSKLPLRHLTKLIPRFYFNRNPGTFLPGQVVNIYFLFKSQMPGRFQERWQMCTEPEIVSDQRIVISLAAFAYSEDACEDFLTIKKYIETKVAKSCVDNTLRDLTEGVGLPIPPYPLYPTMYLEEDIFMHLNPIHFYHPHVVSELRELHKAISSKPWDFSIVNLRHTILNDAPLDKTQDYMERLCMLSDSLLKAELPTVPHSRAFQAVYQILCSFANNLEAESVRLQALCMPDETPSVVELPNQAASNQPTASKISILKPSGASLKKKRVSSPSLAMKKEVSKPGKTPQSVASPEPVQEALPVRIPLDHPAYKEYLQLMFISTNQLLGKAIEQLAATVDSIKFMDGGVRERPPDYETSVHVCAEML